MKTAFVSSTGEGDEGRLRELCEELLGPVRRSSAPPASAAGGEGGGGAAPPSAPDDMQPAAAAATASPAGAGTGVGTPAAALPGLDGRALLREDVLREMSRDRANQRLVSEFQELLAECA